MNAMTREQLEILFNQRQALDTACAEAMRQRKPDDLESDLVYRKVLSAFVRADDDYLAAAREFNQLEAAE